MLDSEADEAHWCSKHRREKIRLDSKLIEGAYIRPLVCQKCWVEEIDGALDGWDSKFLRNPRPSRHSRLGLWPIWATMAAWALFFGLRGLLRPHKGGK